MSNDLKIRRVHKNRLNEDMYASVMLAAFYGMEMSKALNWSVPHRYMQIQKFQAMIRAGHSQMYLAVDRQNQPWAMAIITRTDHPKIWRLEAIMVGETKRRQGIATMLLNELRKGIELHSFATPAAVDWHRKNGFRELGPNTVEGTIEFFTGNYKPCYTYKFAAPLQTSGDMVAIAKLQEMEQKTLR